MKAVPLKIDWNPDLPVFACERYLQSLSSSYGWLGGVREDGTTVCFLPFVVVDRARLRLVRFPVETQPLDSSFDVQSERSFLASVLHYFRCVGADAIVPATFNSLFHTFPDGATAARYGNVIVDLTRSEQALWDSVHHKHRNVIRNAVKQGVTVNSGLELLETAFDLTRESFLRSARSRVERLRVLSRLKLRDFRVLADSLDGSLLVLVASWHGSPQCAAVIPFSRHSAYYMHGGSIAKPVSGASNLVQWEAMRMCQQSGVARYNFYGVRVLPAAGSKAEGLRRFKERFGGDYVEGYMWKAPLRRAGYLLYELAALVRSGGDVVAQERRRLRLTEHDGLSESRHPVASDNP